MSTRVMEEPPGDAASSGMPTVVHCSVPPPKDRGFWLVANIAYTAHDDHDDEFGAHVVDPYEGYAMWKEEAGDWVDREGMSIRQIFGAEMHVLAWTECAERARNCPESDTITHADIHHHDTEWAREMGRAAFFANVQVWHRPTMYKIKDVDVGPFANRAEAVAALAAMLAAPIWPEANAGGQG